MGCLDASPGEPYVVLLRITLLTRVRCVAGRNAERIAMNRLLVSCIVLCFSAATVHTSSADHHEEKAQKVLRHVVLFNFKDDADPATIKKVEEAFAALPSKIDTIKDFEWGTNNSPEGHDKGHTHCFLVTFDSEEGRATYLPHPAHKAFVEVLLPVLEDVTVVDYWAKK